MSGTESTVVPWSNVMKEHVADVLPVVSGQYSNAFATHAIEPINDKTTEVHTLYPWSVKEVKL